MKSKIATDYGSIYQVFHFVDQFCRIMKLHHITITNYFVFNTHFIAIVDIENGRN